MEMIDWKSVADVPAELISQSHFAVLPSVEREAFGLVNVDVMAVGRPQICSPNGAQSEYLADGESALFVPPADAHALAEAMRRLATDPALRREIRRSRPPRLRRQPLLAVIHPRLTHIYTHS